MAEADSGDVEAAASGSGSGSGDLTELREMVATLNEQIGAANDLFKTHEARFETLEKRMTALEKGGGGGGARAKESSKSKSSSSSSKEKSSSKKKGPKSKATKSGSSKESSSSSKSKSKKNKGSSSAASSSSVDKARMLTYRFGSANVNVIRPTEGYPDKAEAAEGPRGKLKLKYSHGYWGKPKTAKQNLYLTADNKYLIYHIAAVGIVMNVEDNTQRFFFAHNDDITCICIDPRKDSPLVATGQKDPKDEPGAGKDLPKIYVWNYKTMEKVQLIDSICWGSISKVAWSGTSGNLYCLCGDDDQTMKVYDSEYFGSKKRPPKKNRRKKNKNDPQTNFEPMLEANTSREPILGMTFHPNPPDGSVDECVLFGKRKFMYAKFTGDKDNLSMSTKQVSVMKLRKEGENSFTSCVFLPDGRYILGATSGSCYIAQGSDAIGIISSAHAKPVGDIVWDANNSILLTGGNDKMLKKWTVDPDKSKKKKWLKLVEEKKIVVPDSDCHFYPKVMQYDCQNDILYAGTRTNQILKFEGKTDSASIVVDGHDGAIWGLATHPTLSLFITGGHDNAIKIWDAKTRKCTWTYEFEKRRVNKSNVGYQVCAAAWSNSGELIVIGTEDSYIGLFKFVNEKELQFQGMVHIPPKRKGAEIEAVAYLRFSPDSHLLACAHMDSNLYIFDVRKKDATYSLKQWKPLPCRAAPTNVQFSADSKIVKTFGRDYEVCHFNLDTDKRKGKFDPSIPDPDVVTWADDPLIAGWDVQGLYQDGWDGTDLNDATVTSDRKLIVSGDDYGNVRIHNFPAVDREACVKYPGHAEFVVGVEFLRDDSQVITCGGSDMAIFQWELTRDGDDSKEDS